MGTIVNGDFEDGATGWDITPPAEVTSDYGAWSGSAALALEAQYDPNAGGFALQVIPVSEGDVLYGRIQLQHASEGHPYTSGIEVLWDFVPVFSIDTDSLIEGMWVAFEIPFGADHPGGILIIRALPGYEGPPWTPAPEDPLHRFLVDALSFDPPPAEDEGAQVIAEAVRQWLDAEGFGSEASDLFLSHMPDEPNTCIAVYDQSAGVYRESQALNLDRYGVRIVCRAPTYEEARDQSVAIHARLTGFAGQLAADTAEVVMVDIVAPPTSRGRDERKRASWVAHYALLVVSTGDQFRS